MVAQAEQVFEAVAEAPPKRKGGRKPGPKLVKQRLAAENNRAITSGAEEQAMSVAAGREYDATGLDLISESANAFVKWLQEQSTSDRLLYVSNIAKVRAIFFKSFRAMSTPAMYGVMQRFRR